MFGILSSIASLKAALDRLAALVHRAADAIEGQLPAPAEPPAVEHANGERKPRKAAV